MREQFRAELATVPAEQLVYLYETRMENHEARAYGWSPQGKPCWGEEPGSSTQRVSLLDALHQQHLIAPFVFEGTCNTALFEAYIEHCLVPVLKPGGLVIYDHASFPQSAKARQLIEGAGCTQKFRRPTPQTSTPLNPIGVLSNSASGNTFRSTTVICTERWTPYSPSTRHLEWERLYHPLYEASKSSVATTPSKLIMAIMS